MVRVRTMILLGVAAIYLSLGMQWFYATVGTELVYSSLYLNSSGICSLTPSNSSAEGWAAIILQPHMCNDYFFAPLWLFAIAFFVSIVSIINWKYSLIAGVVALIGSLLWIIEVNILRNEVLLQLSAWPGFQGEPFMPSSIGMGPGPYSGLLGGCILLLAYILALAGKLEVPT